MSAVGDQKIKVSKVEMVQDEHRENIYRLGVSRTRQSLRHILQIHLFSKHEHIYTINLLIDILILYQIVRMKLALVPIVALSVISSVAGAPNSLPADMTPRINEDRRLPDIIVCCTSLFRC
jgi:hypothetical protein